jgi:hypothetical protein
MFVVEELGGECLVLQNEEITKDWRKLQMKSFIM